MRSATISACRMPTWRRSRPRRISSAAMTAMHALTGWLWMSLRPEIVRVLHAEAADPEDRHPALLEGPVAAIVIGANIGAAIHPAAERRTRTGFGRKLAETKDR